MKSLALVESPAQLLNVLEWAHETGADLDGLTTVVLAPRSETTRRQLKRTGELAILAGHTVRWLDPRRDTTLLQTASALHTAGMVAAQLRGVERLIVGDPFSGAMQLVLGLSRVSHVVVVDDGTATIEFARLWQEGMSLVRWHSAAPSMHRRHIASLASRRIAPGSGCQVSLFTAMPVDLQGAEVIRNRFSWLRSRYARPDVKPGSDLIGTSLVETGVVDETHYLHGVRRLAEAHGIDRYFAHRKEAEAKLLRIASMGVQVMRPDLPLEIVARQAAIGKRMLSFPSTVVHTLPLVLSDTASELLVCDIAGDWFTSRAPSHSDRFLGQVATSARATYGLDAVAC